MSGGTALAGLYQVAQRTIDLEASIAFYRDVLGLKFVAKFVPPGLAFFEMDGTYLLLDNVPEVVKQDHPGSPLYFRVDDFDGAYAALRARGVVFEGEPHVIFPDETGQFGPAGENVWMVFFRDPSGNTLALAGRKPI